MDTDPVNELYTSKQLTKKSRVKKLNEVLDQSNQSIYVKNNLHTTSTLYTIFHKPTRESNLYVWFVYIPLTMFNHTRVQVTGSINAEPIKWNKKVNNLR